MTRFKASFYVCVLLFSLFCIFEPKAQTWQTVTQKIFIQAPTFSYNDAARGNGDCRPGIDYSIMKDGVSLFDYSSPENYIAPYLSATNNHTYGSFFVFPEGNYSFRFKNNSVVNNHNEAWVLFETSPNTGYYYTTAGAVSNVGPNNTMKFYQQLGKGSQSTTQSYNFTNISPTSNSNNDNLKKRFITNVREKINNVWKISPKEFTFEINYSWVDLLKGTNQGYGPWLPVNSVNRVKIYDPSNSNYVILIVNTGAKDQFGSFYVEEEHGLNVLQEDIWLSNFSYNSNGTPNFTVPSGTSNDVDYGIHGFLKSYKISPNVMWENNYTLTYGTTAQYTALCGNTCTTAPPTPTNLLASPSTITTTNGSSSLSASACSGGTLTWYKASDNTTVTSPVSPTSTTNYYAKCIVSGCPPSNPSANVTVAVNIPSEPACNISIAHVGSPPSDCLAGQGNTKSFGWIVNGNIYGNDLQRSTDNVNWSDGGSIWLDTSFENYVYIRIKASPTNVGKVWIKANSCGTQSVFTPCSIGNTCTTAPPTPTNLLASPSTITTTNGSSSLSASACSGGTLTWYKASDNTTVTSPVSPTSTTNYYAKCIVSGCPPSNPSANVTVAVNIPSEPACNISIAHVGSPPSDCIAGQGNTKGFAWIVNGNLYGTALQVSQDNYNWYDGGSTWLPTSFNGYVYVRIKTTPTSVGRILIKANACGVQSEFTPCSMGGRIGVKENIDSTVDVEPNTLTVSPNPSTTKITISASEIIEKVEILDQSSKSVLSQNFASLKSTVISMDISKLPTKIYILQVKTVKGYLFKKIIKQ